MRLTHHIALSALVSAALWLVGRSGILAFSSLCTGVLIDLDHWLDFFRDHGRPKSLRHFFAASYGRDLKKAWLVLHGWEWIALGLAAAWWSGWNPWLLGGVLGWAQHLAADQVFNRPSRWGYWLVWRWRRDFSFSAAFPE